MVPKFFLPGCETESQEATYAELASRCGRVVPALAERVYSITFRNEPPGTIWTATVGETLEGIQRRSGRTKSKPSERKVSDRATILAIFAGSPYFVWTNGEQVGSAFESPYFMASPESVTCFSA